MSKYQDIFAQIFTATGEAEPEAVDRNIAYTLYPEYAGAVEPESSKQFEVNDGNVILWSKWLTVHNDKEAQQTLDAMYKIPLKNSDLKVGRMVTLSKQIMPPHSSMLRRHLRLEPLPEPDAYVGWAAYPVVKTGGKGGPDFGVKTAFVTSFPLQDSRPASDGSHNRSIGYPTYHAYRFSRADVTTGDDLPPITVYLDGDKPEFHPDILNDEERGVTARTIANILACSGGGKDRYLTLTDLESVNSPITDGQEEGPSYGLAVLQASLGYNMPIAYTGEVTHDSTGRIVLRPIGDLRSKVIATVTSSRDGFLSKVVGSADAMLVAVPGAVESGTIKARYSVGTKTRDAFRYTSDLMFKAADSSAHPYCYLAVDLSGVMLAQISHSAGAAQVIRDGAEERAAEEDKKAALENQAKAQSIVNTYALDPSTFTGEMATKFYAMDPAEQKAELDSRIARKVPVELSYLDDKDHAVKTKEYSIPLFDLAWWNSDKNPFYQFIFAGARTDKYGRVITNIDWDKVPALIRDSDEVRGSITKYFMGVPRRAKAKGGVVVDSLAVAMRKGRFKKLVGWLQAGSSKLAAAKKAAMGYTVSKNSSKLAKAKSARTRAFIETLREEPAPTPVYTPVTARSYKRTGKRSAPKASTPSSGKRKSPARAMSTLPPLSSVPIPAGPPPPPPPEEEYMDLEEPASEDEEYSEFM